MDFLEQKSLTLDINSRIQRDSCSLPQILKMTAEIFNLNENLINPIETSEQKALRPKNAGLNYTQVKKYIKLKK